MRKRYLYLANPKSLEVLRFNVIQSPDGDTLAYFRKLNSGKFFRTTKDIFKRFQKGLITEATFKDVEYPINSGRFIKANLIY